MSITTDKIAYGWDSWEALSKNAADRACDDSHTSDDVGILWAEDRIAELTAENERYKTVLESIAEEEDTLGWIYAARMAKAALEVVE